MNRLAALIVFLIGELRCEYIEIDAYFVNFWFFKTHNPHCFQIGELRCEYEIDAHFVFVLFNHSSAQFRKLLF